MTAKCNDVDALSGDKRSNTSFSLEVLQTIKEAQQQHGLRHGDYQRYRGYCSRRLQRIRKSLHFPQGDKRRVHPKPITEETLKNARFLHLPLFCSERAWAYAMQLKSESNTELRKKYHLVARLKKAVFYADELLRLCESPKCDARTKLEAQAYNSWMHGCLEFEQEHWMKAMEVFNNAKTIYEKLASAFSEETRLLYLQKVEEIKPNIRYSAYNIGDESALKDLQEMRIQSGGGDQLASTIDDLLSQTREKQAATLSEVTWRGRTVPVKHEQVRVFLVNLQESSGSVKAAQMIESKISVYESLLKQCVDALQVLRDALADDQNFRAAQKGQNVDGQLSNLHYLYTYVAYLRLTKTIDRNLLLIESLVKQLPGHGGDETKKKVTKPQDLVRLCDTVIQNLGEVANLPGLTDDEALLNETNIQIDGYKAFRTFYIGESYASARKWPEAVALYEKSLSYAETALKGYKSFTGDQEKAEVESLRLENLVKQVDGLKYSCHASSILDINDVSGHLETTHIKDNQPLSERLEQYVEDSSLTSKKPNLVTFPPDFQPIPARPLFFDLALNHIEFPSLAEKTEQKKGGITGIVKGWFWGKK